MSVQVDDAFVRDVQSKLKAYANREEVASYIAATLAVAAERGMVVPDDARRMWAVKTNAGLFHPCGIKRAAELNCQAGETVVRVAVVEIKE